MKLAEISYCTHCPERLRAREEDDFYTCAKMQRRLGHGVEFPDWCPWRNVGDVEHMEDQVESLEHELAIARGTIEFLAAKTA